MPVRVRRLEPSDVVEIVVLSLRAWSPVFESLRDALGDDLFLRLHPDWRSGQEQAVRATCAQEEMSVWVADDAGAPVGFVAFAVNRSSLVGSVEMLAVDPPRQGAGIGTMLTTFAFDALREAGMHVAMVETGGDSGHAPARRTYERTGCTLLPIARYFTTLDHEGTVS